MGYFILFNILLNSYSQISPYGHVHDMDTPNRNQDSCNLFLCNNYFLLPPNYNCNPVSQCRFGVRIREVRLYIVTTFYEKFKFYVLY